MATRPDFEIEYSEKQSDMRLMMPVSNAGFDWASKKLRRFPRWGRSYVIPAREIAAIRTAANEAQLRCRTIDPMIDPMIEPK